MSNHFDHAAHAWLLDDRNEHIMFVGMDCEMVGVGRRGQESMLARCSLVTLERAEEEEGEGREMLLNNKRVKVLYDAYVKPSKNVTDYRTQWSGITKERLQRNDVITLGECRMNVLQILSSSPDGRIVVLVGHALKNDFEVLNIQHPPHLTRDTAWYRPFMRPTRKRFYSRKLSELTREHLGIIIQNDGVSSLYQTEKETGSYSLGHDSIEDATSALLLYHKVSLEWELGLGFPLRKYMKKRVNVNHSEESSKRRNRGEVTLYLDGCNLPIGLKYRKNYKDGDAKFQLISKTKAMGNKIVQTPIDWIPLLQLIISCSSYTSSSRAVPPITKICVFFDGKMFSPVSDGARPKKFNDLGDGLYLEVSDESVEVDDVLVERVIEDRTKDNVCLPKKKVCLDIDHVVEELSNGLNSNGKNNNKNFVVVKRKGGGSKTNKKLFDKLRLRRGEEGAFCLVPALIEGSPRIQKHSLQIARQLKRAKVHQVVEYEQRPCKDVRSIVVTDDVLLSDRIVAEGGVVLSYGQLQQLI
eukprot:CAMPEP_0203670756 /NCGR_PEP_ID=MMETSP0090-20130426/6742_1 /ASSEMBLY_ACC=CAM_ASM_001088 /TAXON_ID=426623 /ORGANISM="Chaetoceros affinis, Strain CCMP159" /LENGTH=525 /DNA_ID=CAMNT_0050535685 /DNA_START=105 /DNA_END=1682 /DNA_ORIENTATION=-